MSQQGMNMGQVKIKNRSVILRCINKAGAISRKDIAEETGLTAAAVTLICNDFIEENLLYEGDSVKKEAGTGAGRRKVLVSIDYKQEYFAVAAIETDNTVIAITDMQGKLVEKVTVPTDKNVEPEVFLKSVASTINSLKSKINPEIAMKIKHGAVSIPGITDSETGTSVAAYGLWNNAVPVCRILQENTGIKFTIENNVTSFAKAEQIFGTGRNNDNVLVIKWGPGVGATTFVENHMYSTLRGKSAEIGHFIVNPEGKQCACGRKGCLETLVSAQVLENSTIEEAFKAIDTFAITIVNLMTVLEPDRIILYGKLAQNETYRNRLLESCKAYSINYNEKTIRYSKLVDCEDYIGPVSVAMEDFIFLGK